MKEAGKGKSEQPKDFIRISTNRNPLHLHTMRRLPVQREVRNRKELEKASGEAIQDADRIQIV